MILRLPGSDSVPLEVTMTPGVNFDTLSVLCLVTVPQFSQSTDADPFQVRHGSVLARVPCRLPLGEDVVRHSPAGPRFLPSSLYVVSSRIRLRTSNSASVLPVIFDAITPDFRSGLPRFLAPLHSLPSAPLQFSGGRLSIELPRRLSLSATRLLPPPSCRLLPPVVP